MNRSRFFILYFLLPLFLVSSNNLKAEQSATPSHSVSEDLKFAYLWNPKWILPNSPLKSRWPDFKLLKAKISKENFITPSGQRVYGLKPDPNLKKIFTFNAAHLIYIFVSDANLEFGGLDKGVKAFVKDVTWPGEKMDGFPVAWIPPFLKGAVAPGDALTLIFPTSKLKCPENCLESFACPLEKDWLAENHKFTPSSKAGTNQGKKIYENYCAACHGFYGEGQGPASVFLDIKPRNFISGEYKFKTTLSSGLPVDADLYRTITHGLCGTAMPSYQFLKSGERRQLIKYIKTFAVNPVTGKNPFKKNKMQKPLSIREPKLDESQIASVMKKGEDLFYGTAKCNDCHGPGSSSKDHLPHGDGPSAPVQMDDWGYPVKPADLAGGILKGGNSPREIYLVITTGMTGTPMPTYHDTLTVEQRWDIAYYVSRLNRLHSLNHQNR